MVLHIKELIKSNNYCIEEFEQNKDMAKAIFDVSHPKYCCRTRIELNRYPHIHYEVIAYPIPMIDRIDMYKSTDGTNWHRTN